MSESAAHRARMRNPVRHRGFGGLVMAIAAIILAAFVAILIGGIVNKQSYPFDPVPRADYVPSSNPITLAIQGIPPFSTTAAPLPASATVRTIQVEPGHINLLAGGKLQRQVLLGQAPVTLQAIIDAINDPAWVAAEQQTVALHAALIFERGVSATIATPLTRHVTMSGQPGVFIAVHGANLTFNGVRIDTRPLPGTPNNPFRSFVMASGGTMNAINSTFTGLGWDWNSSYGASWGDTATGTVTGSTFDGNFIGMYTARAHDMHITYDTFSNNTLYGLDPHTYSTRLLIDHVRAFGNRAHGIIFSDNVTDSTVTNSVSYHNGENGIMLDKLSRRNTISGNESYDNHGDGIVAADSPENTISGNTVRSNRVGIRTDGDVEQLVIGSNTIIDNCVAAEGTSLSPSNNVTENGGQLRYGYLRAVGVLTIVLMVLVTIIYVVWRAALNRRDRRALSLKQPGA